MAVHWPVPAGLHTRSPSLPVEGRLPSFGGATGWLNSPPLTADDKRGKVILAGFWTYTCINWLRQLPSVRAWAGKYAGHGLVVIGVHTPEFPFEHDLGNVRRAVQAAAELSRNHWALSGDWTMGEQAATLNEPGGQIAYRFHARDLHLVMGPAVGGTPVPFRVRIDGQPPGAAHGVDVDGEGDGTVTEPRLHQLIMQPGPITDRTFEITFLDPGTQAYAFTFG